MTVQATFDPGNRLIVAVDVPDRDAADRLVAQLGGAASWLKIGLELFVATGPDLVKAYVAAGARIMLDLKLHDIPATVSGAVTQAAMLGAELLTVHTGGGHAMLQAAVAAARAHRGARPRILGVTLLTSLADDDLTATGLLGSVDELVLRRAELAVACGCDGVVASPREAAHIRAMAPPDFLIVTPGIRPAGAAIGDQKRVASPRMARAAGADLVVCGRPIRDAADPADAARQIASELAAHGAAYRGGADTP